MIIRMLISIVSYFILMYLSVNLLGLFVRGLFPDPKLDELKKDTKFEFLKHEIEHSQRANVWTNITALILNIIYFYLLIHFWNIGVVIAVLIIMAGRLPDLLWDIEHGKKTDPKLMKHNALFYISAILPWLAFPVLYFSLYR